MPDPLTRAAFADTSLVPAPTQSFTWVFAKPADTCSICGCCVRTYASTMSKKPADTRSICNHYVATSANKLLHVGCARSVHTCGICVHFVGTCANTVAHVGVCELRSHVQHSQRFLWQLRHHSVSRWCTPNPQTGGTFADASLVREIR